MPALTWDIHVEAGSYEPSYITVTDPTTGEPVDLTAPGFEVSCVVATRRDGTGAALLTLDEASGVWRRTADGRIYFEPSSSVSSGWAVPAPGGYHQIELSHPAGETVRVAEGRFHVSAELVKEI